jgi:hypothetical protein
MLQLGILSTCIQERAEVQELIVLEVLQVVLVEQILEVLHLAEQEVKLDQVAHLAVAVVAEPRLL